VLHAVACGKNLATVVGRRSRTVQEDGKGAATVEDQMQGS
jgi:hypothetical protein